MEKEVIENQPAPEVAEVKAPEGQAQKADVQNASEQTPKASETKTAPNTETTGQPEVDYRKSYDELRPQFTRTTQELSRLKQQHGLSTRELAELKKGYEQLAAQLETVTNQPVSPDEFLKNLQTQGPKALDSYFDKRFKNIKSEYEKAYASERERSLALEAGFEKMKRSLDKTNYPDFDKLEATMQEVLDAENCPIDTNKLSIGEIYDALYKLARSKHSEEAIKAAEEMGRKSAEAALVKESVTTVTGGGKAGSTTNPAEINDLSKLRQYFVSQLGEAE